MSAEIDRETGDGTKPADDEAAHEYGPTFWVGTIVGWAIIAYGTVLLLGDDEAEWFNTARLVAIGIVAHDVVWLAVSVGTAWALAHLLGRRIPHWIRWAGWTSAIVIAIWLPLARGYGDRLGNDTILPRNYTTSIVVLLPAIWIGAGVWGVVSARRAAARYRVNAGSDAAPS